MQAVVMQEHGDPGVLRMQTVDDPVVPAGSVLVELRAAALNRRDCLNRAGIGPAYRFDMPLILGSRRSRVRRDTGEDVVILPGLQWGRRAWTPACTPRMAGWSTPRSTTSSPRSTTCAAGRKMKVVIDL